MKTVKEWLELIENESIRTAALDNMEKDMEDVVVESESVNSAIDMAFLKYQILFMYGDKEPIQLHIIAEDYLTHGPFENCYSCLLATAARRQFSTTNVDEQITEIAINGTWFDHPKFDVIDYDNIMKDKAPFTLILTPQ